MKVEFTIQRLGEKSQFLIIISRGKEGREIFPDAGEDFILVIEGRQYTTSVKDLEGGRTSIARTFEQGKAVSLQELCTRHNLKEGGRVYIEPEIPFKKYGLSRADAAPGEKDRREDDASKGIGQDAVRQLLAEKGGFTGEEFFAKLKQIQDRQKKEKNRG